MKHIKNVKVETERKTTHYQVTKNLFPVFFFSLFVAYATQYVIELHVDYESDVCH